ncbi:hypothetical protein A3I95_01475 [Candidatus Nomurabacteria bacterium RIFCSPLOWO2_02_FULL_44_12]|uniref:Uncharacterized protein n=1 Tax=Candidatus Nomurabacteria bacterium RIFCSPLOWO2_12_FULL_44_11 TaxID=1801796 RepID=A0A1F6Y4G7_9BACT|nr:MAG: hypothetical protein A3E95_02345 [Candidatus Nomurabacteria bacterium RIFCSPHIGHO2_12_FULL_44_22b]OGJ01273.1 MAG: hypothetical protein A3G53_03270 [Candidatus Nomurabacteria bacterium RIFCSPLOWO2_12_FULL_44_11]OGJ08560.1 MAG: hypothetical protein A3I95_01475 [Candidatus Nomurabacteria bacterium RIFCSPLOWO2_02_FULL_44_12]
MGFWNRKNLAGLVSMILVLWWLVAVSGENRASLTRQTALADLYLGTVALIAGLLFAYYASGVDRKKYWATQILVVALILMGLVSLVLGVLGMYTFK